MATNKGFIKDYQNNILLPITRGELILDSKGEIALFSNEFIATSEHPGLITSAEKAMLQGSTGGNFGDLYNKINHINSGLYFNNQELNFYKTVDNNIISTPIKINGSNNQISITTTDNTVQIGLSEIETVKTGSQGIIKSIDVDKYGRVTSITQSDLQSELSNKTIENVILKNCITNSETIGSDDKSIVNKKYVDDSIKGITGLATGALKFGGIINSYTIAKSYLNATYLNNYYKVTENFTLDSSDLYESSNTSIKKGDTLIVYLNPNNQIQFVHVPSGDEETTTISVYVNNENDVEQNVLNNAFGNIKFKFSNIFNVENIENSNIATINLKKAGVNQSGYLSAEDYAKFDTYSSKSISFKQTLTSGYEIGKFVLDNSEITVYGKDTISTLSLINNGENPINPILKFKKSGEDSLNIGFIGNEGLNIKKNNNNIEFNLNNLVDDNSKKYLEIKDGYKFNIKKGSVNENTVINGITDYEEFNTFKIQSIATHALATQFLEINNSLSPSSTDGLKYYYGSTDLVTAITL